VLDARGEAGLVEEHRHELGILGELRVQPLDGDGLREAHRPEQTAEVHGGHAPGGDLAVHRVASDDADRAFGHQGVQANRRRRTSPPGTPAV
jgi:hypothetical protein